MRTHTDGRRVDAATQAHVRRTAVKAVRAGMTQTAAASTFGVSVRAVNKWMAVDKSGGLRALAAKQRGRPVGAGSLSAAQATKVRQQILDRMPDQLKLGFYLWTRAAVVALIARQCHVTVSLTTVGRYLRAWGFSVQKPVRRAYERNDAAIARWLKREYPAIARDARREGATIYWGDEMGLRRDHVTGTSYAPVGRTPIVRATGQRFGCNMISAITNRGQLVFRVFQGTFRAPMFVDFMRRLRRQSAGKVYLIVDGHPVHRSRVAKAYVAAHADDIRLIRLPGTCPELNPDELLNQDVKTNALGKSRPRDRAEMMMGVRRHLYRRQKQPHIIRNLFQERHVRYAA
ncbi:IS630 family transposase [Gemmatimonas sp.]|uniref:IS630 family transposase n=1 Tax=Gemmatimonas sp. TaxID=1962908 RepID=UPI00286BAC22|nr:IS630 family transposase [Gemmatimonas sp.]